MDVLVDPRLGAKRIADIGEARIFDPGGEIEQHRISPEIGALQIEILDRGISAVGEQRGPVIIGPDLHPPLIDADRRGRVDRSEEHTSELQSLMRTSYAVFCLKKKKHTTANQRQDLTQCI